MALSPAETLSRRAFDWRVATALQSSALGAIRAFRDHEARRAGKRLSNADGARGLACLYEVDFTFPFLTGPGTEASRATAVFDATSPLYPYACPIVTFVTMPRPWSTHVHPTGVVCLGEFWRKERLLAQLIVHVMKIANLDEPVRDRGYDGYSAEAYTHWKHRLGARPYVPNLAYPALPVEITHGSTEVRPVFAISEPVFFVDAPGLEESSVFEEIIR